MERIDKLANLGYKLAASVGALVTFLYLFSIQFFPSSLTPGEAIFFLFVAFAFGFIYIVFVVYSAFSMIWFVCGLNWLVTKKKGTATRISTSEWYKAVSGYAWLSALVFMFFLVIAIGSGSPKGLRLVIVLFTVGFMVLCIALPLKADQSTTRAPSSETGWPRWSGWAFLAIAPFAIVCVLMGASFFTHLTFSGIGVRSENVSIELADSESGPVNRASELIGQPLIDCKRSNSDKIVVHGANVLWAGIGDMALIEFELKGEAKTWDVLADPKPLKSVRIPFEAKNVRVIKANPPLDRCLELPSDLLFDSAQHSLSAAAIKNLERLVGNMIRGEHVAKLHVRGHSDARRLNGTATDPALDNQKLSELRARTVAVELQRFLKLSAEAVTSDGAGKREPRVKCDPQLEGSKYELEQCTRPNRRVEIQLTLSKQASPAQLAAK